MGAPGATDAHRGSLRGEHRADATSRRARGGVAAVSHERQGGATTADRASGKQRAAALANERLCAGSESAEHVLL